MTHIVIGGGPLGRSTARSLAARGERVRLASRSARAVEDERVEVVRADATDPASLAHAVAGADVVYNCANAPYDRWPDALPPIWDGILAAAQAHGARLVIGSNLYAYGKPAGPLTADAPFAPCTRKGEVRARLERHALDEGAAHGFEVAIVRSSDFYGPEVRDSMLGERFFGPLVAGRPASAIGRRDVPHSYAYLPDFGETMAAVGSTERGRLGQLNLIIPHAEPVTLTELERVVGSIVPDARISSMGGLMLRLGSIFVKPAREIVEMLYEFVEPFTVDDSTTRERFGLTPTALAEGIERTLAWYQGGEYRGAKDDVHEQRASEANPTAPVDTGGA